MVYLIIWLIAAALIAFRIWRYILAERREDAAWVSKSCVKVGICDYLVTLGDGRQFRGSCTGWHTVPSAYRVNSYKTIDRLHRVWTQAQWKENTNE